MNNTVSDDFLVEAEDILDHLGTDIADLADAADDGEYPPELLNSIFRSFHSLKGLAGMFGYEDVTELAHNTENLLDQVRMGKTSAGRDFISVLFESHRILRALIDSSAAAGAPVSTPDIRPCIDAINAVLLSTASSRTVDGSPLPGLGLPERITASLTEYEEHRLLENVSRGRNIFIVHITCELGSFDHDLENLTAVLKQCGEVISTLPGISECLDTHIDFDILFGSVDSFATLTTLIADDSVRLTLPVCGAELQNLEAAINRDNREQGETGGHGIMTVGPSVLPESIGGMSSVTSVKGMSRTVRVDIDKLDELMSTVGELVLVNSTISELTDRLRHEGAFRASMDLSKAATQLNRRLQDLQRGVMNIRMVPVAQIYEKLSLVVRNISREQGKKVELRFYGADTELDKLIADDISDPLMHIIRNSIDHGIESPQKRRLSGKSEKGVISISSCQRGNHVVMEVEDDGAGIDLEKIRDLAVMKGIVTDRSQLTDREVMDLIFIPGFSTSDSVTGISGRGVGMDVVRCNIGAVSGQVDVESRFGNGTRFIITLPITLAIIRSLIIRTTGRTYALPVSSVKESLIITERDIMTVERREMVQLRDQTLPLLRLGDFFGSTAIEATPDEFYVVVVGAAEKRLGIVVDGLAGQQDIVIKPLGSAFRALRGISGAAELGDRSTILVLDINGIVNEIYNPGS